MVVTLTNNSFTFLLSSKIKCRASSNIIMVSCLKSKSGNREAKKLKRSFEKKEVWDSIDGWVKQNILPMAKPIEKCWQPQDLLPNPCSESFFEEVKELRKRSKQLSDEYFVVLVGNMITEEALPTYQSRWTIADKVQDITGIDDSSWAIWARAWSAEENRHGDLLNKYLYLSGRVDMNRVENTIQHLIAFGMDNKSGTDSYKGMFYASFQERATFISHANTAKLAKKQGDEKLAQICGVIASDEKRHESAYTKTLEKLFEVDPDGCIIVFADMMRKKITMPAHLMFDGKDLNLFSHFSNVASRLGVYTALDYIDILEHFVVKWKVDKLRGLSSEGQRAQHYVCELGQRLRKVEERAQKVFSETEPVSFSWIFDKRV